MAVNKYQVVQVTSDISGDPDAHAVDYSYKGQHYSIDLTEAEEKTFHNVLSPYIAVSQVGRKRKPRVRATPEETTSIRDWARKNGYALNDQGRIPNAIREAYDAAQKARVVKKAAKAPVKKAVKKSPVKKAAKKTSARRRA